VVVLQSNPTLSHNFILTQRIINGNPCKITTETSEKLMLFSHLFCDNAELECNLIYCELV
jgi:hypothetical protein